MFGVDLVADCRIGYNIVKIKSMSQGKKQETRGGEQ